MCNWHVSLILDETRYSVNVDAATQQAAKKKAARLWKLGRNGYQLPGIHAYIVRIGQ